MKKIITLAFICAAFITKAQTNNTQTQIITTTSKTETVSTVYKSGKVKAKGNIINDKRDGEWVYYHENGKIALKKNFEKGVETGQWLYYNENGELSMKIDDIAKIDNGASLSLIKDGKVVTTKKVTKENVLLKF